MADHPGDVDALYALGVAHASAGEPESARGCFEEVIERQPDHCRAHNNLGAVLSRLGRPEAALACHRRAWELAPGYTLALQNVCKVLAALRRFDEAQPVVAELIRCAPRSAVAWVLAGVVQNGLRNVDGAIDALERALELDPEDDYAWTQFGAVLNSQGRLAEAARALRIATELRPRNPEAWTRLGGVLHRQQEIDGALACCQTAIAVAPASVRAYAQLGTIFEKANRLDEAEAAIDAALRLDPSSAIAHCRRAEIDHRRGRHRDGLDRLRRAAALDASVESLSGYQGLLGKLQHALGAYDEAFAAFDRANQLDRASPHGARTAPEAAADFEMTEVMRDWLTPQRIAAWPSAIGDGRPRPVFLVGFPRSGTTLMDVILSSHSAVTTLDEQPVLQQVTASFVGDRSGLERLARLSDPEVRALRGRYWQEVADRVGPLRGVIVDKMPLNIILLGLIARLFPEARVVVALRHPLDSILSCFMQRFLLNAKMYNFLSLESTARYYALVMGMYQQHREFLPLASHAYRYEDVLDDFEAEVGRLLSFLRLPWEESVRDYQTTAGRRLISTPSYTEVVRPLHREALYRWHCYRDQLSAVRAQVEPLIEAFGYGAGAPQATRDMPLNSSALSSMALA